MNDAWQILKILENVEKEKILENGGKPFDVLIQAFQTLTGSSMGYIAVVKYYSNKTSKENPTGKFLQCMSALPSTPFPVSGIKPPEISDLMPCPTNISKTINTTNTQLIKENQTRDILWLKDRDIRSLLVLPLLQGNTTIGQICLANGTYTQPNLQTIEPLIIRCTSLIISSVLREKYNHLITEKSVHQSKNIVLANISHEVRTPLNTILGMNALLLETELDDNQYECLLVQRKSCYHLLGLITDILDINKLEAGKMVFKDTVVNVKELIETSYDMIGFEAKRQGLSLDYMIDPKVPEFVIGDKQRLKQMLGNLLSNAVKFTDRGKIKTCVELASAAEIEDLKLPNRSKSSTVLYDEKLAGSWHYIKFSVKDTGIGIHKEDMGRLFKSYEQLDNSNTKRGKGTGLGLAITSELCTLMHGKIFVNSTFGEGSTFTFIVPMRAYDDPNKELDISILKGKKFLVVDDNEKNLAMLTNLLDAWGVEYVECTSSSRALAWVSKPQHKFDLGLLDIIMPNMDGNTLAERISRTDKPFPLIALSSDDSEHSASNFFSYQLTKPYDGNQLLEAIIHVLRMTELHASKHDTERSDSSEERYKRSIHISSEFESDDEAFVTGQIFKNSDSPRNINSPNKNSQKNVFKNSNSSDNINSPRKVKKLSMSEALVAEHQAEQHTQSYKKESQKKSAVSKRTQPDYEKAINKDINILVVEDQEFNSIMLIKMLKNIGYHNIDLATNGPDAVEMVKKNRGVPLTKGAKSQYDLILMDVIMPGKYDGVVASKKITKLFRSLKERPKIIAVTASIFDGVVDQYMTDGQMDGFITKPIDKIQCITKVLQSIGLN